MKIKYRKIKRIFHKDKRGWFLEVLKFSESNLPIKQVSVASIRPGAIRGNHYHVRKTEWFFVLGGKAEFFVSDPFSKKISKINISEETPVLIEVKRKTAHAIRNTDKRIIYFVEMDSTEYKHKNPDAIPCIICDLKTRKTNL